MSDVPCHTTTKKNLDLDRLSERKLLLAAVLIEYATLTIEESDDLVLPRLRQIAEFFGQLEFLGSELAAPEELYYGELNDVFHLTYGERSLDIALAA